LLHFLKGLLANRQTQGKVGAIRIHRVTCLMVWRRLPASTSQGCRGRDII
jgi:hypothetical protein